MARVMLLACLLLPAALYAQAPVQANYDWDARVWSLSNGLIEARYLLDENGLFRLQTLRRPGGKQWVTDGFPASSPIFLAIDGNILDQNTVWELVATSTQPGRRNGQRHIIQLRNAAARAEVTVRLEIHPGQPFIRTSYTYRNIDAIVHYVNSAHFLDLALNPEHQEMRAFYVDQFQQIFTPAGRSSSLLFEQHESSLSPDQPVRLHTGAYANQCTWLALADQQGNGMVLGWETDARSIVKARSDAIDQTVLVEGTPRPLHAGMAFGQEFPVPPAFMGIYEGDWDEAGYRTQRYVEAVLATPPPDDNFPYLMFDSWGYGEDIDEQTMQSAARVAAQVGVELFIVDLGWAQRIGDWIEDRDKFPSTLRDFSDRVHSLGMKFGLHFVPVEASADSIVLRWNPDWTSSVNNEYFYSKSICLSNTPTQTWLQQAALGVVQAYNPDWFVQDGENPVKECTKDTHTHDPGNSNWDNAVNGINLFIDFMRARAPQAGWENNADGGTMSTYAAVKRYTTSASCDGCGAIERLRAVYGMSYAFPPRFISRYMPEPPTKFTTRSSMFGGPWVLMQPITDWTPADIELVRQEAAIYKSLRGLTRDAKVFHLLGPPSESTITAIESFHAQQDRGVIFVYRPDSRETSQTIYPRGLNPSGTYRVTFQESRDSVTDNGSGLMRHGINVKLPTTNFAEIVYITGG